MAGLSINGNNTQEKALQATLNLTRQFCASDPVSQLNKVDFRFVKGISERGITEKKENDRFEIQLPTQFGKKTEQYFMEERMKTFCHELSHIDYREKNKINNNVVSKDEELYSHYNEELAGQNFLKDRGHGYKPPSKERIMKYLNEKPGYRCLPDKPVLSDSKIEIFKAKAETGLCKLKNGGSDFWSMDILTPKGR